MTRTTNKLTLKGNNGEQMWQKFVRKHTFHFPSAFLKTAEDRLSVTVEYLKRNGDWELGIDDPTTNILREVIIDNGVQYDWISDAIAMKWMDGIDHSQLLYQQGMR